ncbi:MAG: sialate O-acetylesterase [Bacteroidota bacterium]|nr:sialate O-acetylesterase [Bacteroidota bacterium]
MPLNYKLKALNCRIIYFFFIILINHNYTFAEVKLPKLVGDHMVLQRDQQLPIWGWASPGEEVTLLFQDQRIATKADEKGNWLITLAPVPAGGPYDLVISGKNTIRLRDIMIGDVWVCSGQSNMEWKMDWLKEQYSSEFPTAKNKNIRQIEVEKNPSYNPLSDIGSSGWKSVNQENLPNFSAVAYFFAKNLFEQYGIPIGLIYTAWGGTVAEAWTSEATLKNFPEFEEVLKDQELHSSEDIEAAYQKELQAWDKKLKDEKNKNKSIEAAFSKVKFDDKDWGTMVLPNHWENAGLKDFDGVVWFRKIVELPKDLAGKEITLSLGPIDDADSTLFNGKLVGKTSRHDEFREYKIPANLVKEGKNVIAIKITDTGGGGGIYGKKEDMAIKAGKVNLPLHGSWKYKVSLDYSHKPKDPNNPNKPAVLYNGMIAPIVPYAIKGAIWYQGESNADRAKQYESLFPAMIQDWRAAWGLGDFPFLFVQLANFMQPSEEPSESNWAELRNAQLKALSVPNTGMAVIIDIGDANDIHPKNKHDVGKRLALAARKVAYKEEIVYSGPIYESMTVEGDKIRIKFKHTGSGLVIKGEEPKEFAIAGQDNKFYRAKAVIENDAVIVSSDKVQNPVAVRYAWADNPEGANLYNKEGLPAAPFQSGE